MCERPHPEARVPRFLLPAVSPVRALVQLGLQGAARHGARSRRRGLGVVSACRTQCSALRAAETSPALCECVTCIISYRHCAARCARRWQRRRGGLPHLVGAGDRRRRADHGAGGGYDSRTYQLGMSAMEMSTSRGPRGAADEDAGEKQGPKQRPCGAAAIPAEVMCTVFVFRFGIRTCAQDHWAEDSVHVRPWRAHCGARRTCFVHTLYSRMARSATRPRTHAQIHARQPTSR